MGFVKQCLRDLVLPLLTYVAVVGLKLWVDASDPGVWLVIGATLLIALAELLSETNSHVAAFLFVSRVQVALAVLLAAVVASFGVAVVGSPVLPPRLEIIRAMIMGLSVGAGIRHAYVASFRRRRQHRPTYRIRLVLLLAVGAIVVLLPDDGVAITSATYVLSIGIGFFIHYVWRRWDERTTQCLRIGQTILRPLKDPATEPQKPIETLAASRFATRDIDELILLLDGSQTATPGLMLIKAALQRHQGKNLEAVNTLNLELQRRDRVSQDSDALLHLLQGICDRDLGKYGEMNSSFSAATTAVPYCFLATLMDGVTRFEDLPSPGDPDWGAAESARRDAKNLVDDAVRLNTKNRPRLALAAVVAGALPLTRTFFDDVQGYALFKCGNMSTSKKVFEACIEEDSLFAPAYLHLGEWHLANRALANSESDPERAEQSFRTAEFCFRVAAELEPEPSHTRRRAEEFLRARTRTTLRPLQLH